jgi:aldose sugar dehydrogenase
MTSAETRTSGHRAFAPDGKLWEVEHGPRGGDDLNLIEPGKNYGWPLASYAVNYNGVPIPSPDSRPDLAKGAYHRARKPRLLRGQNVSAMEGFGAHLRPGEQDAHPYGYQRRDRQRAGRWIVGHRIRDVEVGADGALWMLEDSSSGGLFRVTPK